MDESIQVGVIGIRAPDGSILTTEQIRERKTPENAKKEQEELSVIGHIFAEKFAFYMRETRKIERRRA